MKKSIRFLRRLLAPLLILTALASPLPAKESRSCIVKEVLKGGMYVYLRCQEGSSEIWLATVAQTFKADEVIAFVDAPPMIDFYSKQLNRTFPAVILTDILKEGDRQKK